MAVVLKGTSTWELKCLYYNQNCLYQSSVMHQRRFSLLGFFAVWSKLIYCHSVKSIWATMFYYNTKTTLLTYMLLPSTQRPTHIPLRCLVAGAVGSKSCPPQYKEPGLERVWFFYANVAQWCNVFLHAWFLVKLTPVSRSPSFPAATSAASNM